MRPFTLRTRLTVAYTAILALALVAFSGIAFVAVHATLGAQLEGRLLETVTAVQPIPDVRGGKIALDPDDRQLILTLLAQNRLNGFVLDGAGTIVFSSVPRPPAHLIDAMRSAHPGSADVNAGGEAIAYRVRPIEHAGRAYGTIAVWSSRSFTDDVARTTLIALLAATLVVVLIAAAIGGVLAQRLMHPLAEVSAVISHIEATDLSERLAWTGPDDELGRLCSTFDRLLDRLEAAFASQGRFTSDASHELRTPLSVMRAEIELALGREREADAYRNALVRLQGETTRLEALIESLLLSARGESTALVTTTVALDDIARRVIDRMRPLADLTDVTFTLRPDAEAIVRVDRPLIESATLAIVDNAIHHAPPGGSVTIAIDIEGSSANLTIADDGTGFSDGALRDATQRFWRDDRARGGRRMGLGLSIAHSIVTQHGGTLMLRNGEAGGAVVRVALPLAMHPLRDERAHATIMNA